MKVNRRVVTADPYRNLANGNDQAVIAWTDANGATQTSVADPGCLKLELETARPIRQPVKYQHRRNYEGYYWCAGSGESVWYESMTEYSALMNLDHEGDLVKVAAQPFCILFRDGTRHYPDYFARHASGQLFVYDVRPLERVDQKAAIQFGKTQKVCEQIGWGYEVLNGVNGVQRHNLEWLAGYRHSYTAPDSETRTQILDAATDPLSLALLSTNLSPEQPVRFVPWIYHMLWSRDLAYNPSAPLGWHTLIERNDRG